MELRAPDRAEAVGDFAEDRAPAQRLLRAVVGRGGLRLGKEDEQLVLPPDQAAAERLGGRIARNRFCDHLRKREEVAPEEGVEHAGPETAHQAFAVVPDADGTAQQRGRLYKVASSTFEWVDRIERVQLRSEFHTASSELTFHQLLRP